MPSDSTIDRDKTIAVLEKARQILNENSLDITKGWLNLLIGQIDDIEALEQFPTQESIRASLQVIEGLTETLRDEKVLDQFSPGGIYYDRASKLGMLERHESGTIDSLGHSIGALENSIWDHLTAGMRESDRELLYLVRILSEALHLIMAAAANAYHKESTAELDKLAHTDLLTELHNRRFLQHEMERHTELHRRYGLSFAVIMLDFDNLKCLNDGFGHAAGDSALQHLAKLMRVSVRDVDICGRFGGDEFLVIMPQADKTAAYAIGRRIAIAVNKTQLKLGRALVTLNVSFGTAACPEDGTQPEVILQEADSALYRAKAANSRGPAERSPIGQTAFD